MLGALLVTAYAVLILAPLAAALADARVETVDDAGAHKVYVPQTQPSDTQPLPRVEVLDVDGMRSVFIPQRIDPTTKPTGLYAEIGGIPVDAKPFASGDVSQF